MKVVLLLMAILMCQVKGFIKGEYLPQEHALACGGDDPNFRDARGWKCQSWSKYTCFEHKKYTKKEMLDVQKHCPVSCVVELGGETMSLCTWIYHFRKIIPEFAVLPGSGRCATNEGTPYGEHHDVPFQQFCAAECLMADHCVGWSYINHENKCEYSCNKFERPCFKGTKNFDASKSCPATESYIPGSPSTKCYVKKSCRDSVRNSAAATGGLFHLAPPGAVQCDYGRPVLQNQCEQVARALHSNVPARYLQVGSGGTCLDGSWGQVPLGCSLQSGGDYTAHYKTSGTVKEGCAQNSYQLVCVDSKFSITAGAKCEVGYEPLTSSWTDCRDAAVSLGFTGDSVNHVDTKTSWGENRPQGCFQSTGINRVYFNRGPGGKFEGTDKIICKLSAGLFHLAPPGAVQCDYGRPVLQNQCEQVARALHSNVPARYLQVGSGGTCLDGSWGQVPLGCSLQSGGDYTAHYKTSGTVKEGCAQKAYQLVCVDSSGRRSLGVERKITDPEAQPGRKQ